MLLCPDAADWASYDGAVQLMFRFATLQQAFATGVRLSCFEGKAQLLASKQCVTYALLWLCRTIYGAACLCDATATKAIVDVRHA